MISMSHEGAHSQCKVRVETEGGHDEMLHPIAEVIKMQGAS